MKEKWKMLMAIICYAAGVSASIYVGAWLMLLQPIHEVMTAFSEDSLTFAFLAVRIIKIVFSTTFAGLVWCIGYIGYNHFKGRND